MRAFIVTGAREAQSRDWYDVVSGALGFESYGLVIIHGACGCDAHDYQPVKMKGIDAVAHEHGRTIRATVLPMPADWGTHAGAAGPQRNREMMQVLKGLGACGYDIGVLAFHDDLQNGSKGTKHMVEHARFSGVPVAVYNRGGEIQG